MKVKLRDEASYKCPLELEGGEVFEYHGEVYIKLNTSLQSTSLGSMCSVRLSDGQPTPWARAESPRMKVRVLQGVFVEGVE